MNKLYHPLPGTPNECMNRSLKNLALNSAHRFGLLQNLHLFDFSHDSLYVLVYHRVDWEHSQPRLDPRNLSATPAQFEQQMRLLSEEYHPVTADDVLAAVAGNKKLPPRAVLVTVDDGYRDFKEYIWPIAMRYQIYPVLFVPTSFVGSGSFWWDQLYDALKRTALKEIETPVGILSLQNLLERSQAFVSLANYMKSAPFDSAMAIIRDLCGELIPDPFDDRRITLDWDELRELASSGVTIAPHTHTHPALRNISDEQVRFELSECQRLIRTEIGSSNLLFAYLWYTSSYRRGWKNTPRNGLSVSIYDDSWPCPA